MGKRSRPMSATTAVDSDVFMRAVAICSVVWNHANPLALGAFGGGMTFLMMLSGFSFARFSLRGLTAPEVRASLVRLGLRIGVPSFLLVLAFFLALRRFDWRELLFVSNWWTIDRISIFPTWYPQVMLQMFALLYVLFLLPAASRWLKRPLAFSLIIFASGLAMRIILPLAVWDTAYLHHNLPHLYLWNFTLGWVVYFLVRDRVPSVADKALAIGCIAAGALAGWGWGRLDFWWLTVFGITFVLVPRVTLPRPIATLAGLLSQSAFTIFLLHRVLFVVLNHIVPAWTDRAPLVHWAFALFASVATWITFTAMTRAYRELDRGQPALAPA